MDDLDRKHNLCKNAPAEIDPMLREAIDFMRVLASSIPGYDASRVTDHHLAAVYVVAITGDLEAAASASKLTRQYVSKLLSSGFHNSLIQQIAKNNLQSQGFAMACKALTDIVSDSGAPAGARVTAAKVIKEWTDGDNARDTVSGKPLAEMTVNELSMLISKLEGAAQLNSATIDITPINKGE